MKYFSLLVLGLVLNTASFAEGPAVVAREPEPVRVRTRAGDEVDIAPAELLRALLRQTGSAALTAQVVKIKSPDKISAPFFPETSFERITALFTLAGYSHSVSVEGKFEAPVRFRAEHDWKNDEPILVDSDDLGKDDSFPFALDVLVWRGKNVTRVTLVNKAYRLSDFTVGVPLPIKYILGPKTSLPGTEVTVNFLRLK